MINKIDMNHIISAKEKHLLFYGNYSRADQTYATL